MILYSKVTEAPETEPLTLDEAKAHLKVDSSDEDAYITLLLKASRKMCETYAGLSFATQTRQVKLDSFPCGSIILPYGPVQSVESMIYIDPDGVETELFVDDDFLIDLSNGLTRVSPVGTNWPTADNINGAITIEYISGYDDIPEEAKVAILLTLASLYENRQDEISGSSSLINWNSQAVLDTIKVYWNAEM